MRDRPDDFYENKTSLKFVTIIGYKILFFVNDQLRCLSSIGFTSFLSNPDLSI